MRLTALAALSLLLPLTAAAEPATVKVFEVTARAEPRAEAAAVQVFTEGSQVSVSEEATAGWRRVRLADGKTAWVPEAALAFPGAAPVPAVRPAQAGPTPPPDLRAQLYVKDLDHLAELVKPDPKVSTLAQDLLQRRNTARGVAIAGYALSAGFIVVGASQFGNHSDLNDPQFGKQEGTRAFVGGVVGALVTTAVVVVLSPKSGDLLDVINAWNTGHPDQPFTIEHGLVGERR